MGHLFRHRAGQMVATLTRIFGIEQLDLVQDVVQEAFVRALRTWPMHGVPANPSAWLIQVAKNRALDVLRRRGRWRGKEAAVQAALLPGGGACGQPAAYFSTEVDDDQLCMMFACCHPALSRDAQVALTLKTVGGFGVDEIAAAFLARPATIAQRLVRAKRALQGARAAFALPAPDELPERFDAVLEVLYLMFNEGYAASTSDELVREDLCHEAIRLIELVAGNRAVASPPVHALAALFYFQASRLATRTSADGELLLLETQDRRQWNRGFIRGGLAHLQRAARGERLSSYHLQAEIASCHALAGTAEATDWHRILACYDALLGLDPSPVVALNRVVAVLRVDGADAADAALEPLLEESRLQGHYLLHAVHGEVLLLRGDTGEAHRRLTRAAELASNASVRRFLEAKAAGVGG